MKRSRRHVLTLAVALGISGAALFPVQAVAEVSLALSPKARFPERSLILTLPEQARLTAKDVQVSENGTPVRGLRVAEVGAARRAKLGVVLAVDASASMRGPAYAGAIAAARAFAAARNGDQPLALITFGTDLKLLLPFTDDEQRIEAALADPGAPAGGTHMYDAALRSIELVRRQKLPGGFLVVLSDGTDHGSAATDPEVLAAARAANVRIYTVGLRSARFDPEALTALADGAGGSYSEAKSATELRDTYSALGAQLSNAHVLRYRSTAAPEREIEVRAAIAGVGGATTRYRSPALAVEGGASADRDAKWDSPAALVVVVSVVAGLLGLALVTVLRGPRQSPRDRVAQFVAPTASEAVERTSLTGRLGRGAERSLARAGWWQGFATDVDVAAIRYSPGQLVVVCLLVTLSLAFAATSFAGTAAAGLAVLLLAPFVGRLVVRARAQRERRLFGDQLADHLAVVGGSLRVGHSLPAALTAALDEAPEPSRREFTRAVADERLGLPLEESLANVSRRMDNREVEHVALLAKLQREAGADAGEMVDQVVTTVRERQELRRTVRTLTAQGRFAQVILSFLPPVSLLVLTVTNKPYVEPLYTTTGGNIVLGIAAILVVLGSLVIRKIVTINI